MNKVFLIGTAGADPEFKKIQSGSVTRISVATTEKWKSEQGNQERTEWHKVVCFNKLAELCTKYVVKGSLIMVEGKLQTRSFETREGEKKFVTEIVASTVKFLDSNTQRQKADQPSFDEAYS